MPLKRALRISVGILLLLEGCVCYAADLAQQSSPSRSVIEQVTATNPKYPEFFDAPFQSQLKSLVQGSKAESLPDSKVLIQEAKVQEFETNGQTKLLIETPRCIYDRSGHVVTSPEALHVQTGDGKFMVDGMGFFFVQSNGLLHISNAVHTFVQADLLRSGSTNAAAGSTPKVGDLEITSDRLIFETNGIARYIGKAHVSSTNLSLNGGSILIVAPTKGKQLESLTVETNVLMDYGNMHVQGDRATYTAQDGIARVTGNPAWRSEDREGRGDELVVDATNKVFRANGHAFLEFSAANLTNSSFMPGLAPGSTNASSTTNRIVQITSDFYEFRTNHGEFGDHVVMTEIADGRPGGTMTCGALEVAFTGTNELQSMIARTNVVIQESTNRLTAAIANYNGTTRMLELTGDPSWQSGDRQGKGQTIEITPYDQKMVVRGDAWARVPAKDLGSATSFGTNQVTQTRSAAKSSGEEYADIYSDQYTIKTNQARFVHHVRIIHPQINWACDRLSIDSLSATGKHTLLLAEGSVTFAMSNENKQPVHGTCDRAEYTYNDTVDPLIDRMEMTGHPVMEMTNAVLRNAIIIYDRTSHQVFMPGEYAMSGTANALGTNSAIIPRKR